MATSLSETQTATSEKFTLNKNLQYVYELRTEDLWVTNPSSDNAQNFNQNGTVSFVVGAAESVLDFKRAVFRIKFQFQKNDGTAIAAGDVAARNNFTLENNWFMKWISQASVKINGSVVETITDPGEIDTLLKHLFIDYTTKQESVYTSWMPDKGDGAIINELPVIPAAAGADVAALITQFNTADTGLIAILNNLRTRANDATPNTGYRERKRFFSPITSATIHQIDVPIGILFGFFEQERVWKGKGFEIEIVIKANQAEVLVCSAAGSNCDVKVNITGIQLLTPKYDPSAPILESLNQQLTSPIRVEFLKRQFFTRISETSNHIEWEISQIRNRIRYVFIWAKPNNQSAKTVNNDRYFLEASTEAGVAETAANAGNAIPARGQYKITGVRLQIDDNYYPYRAPLSTDFSSKNNSTSFQDLLTYYYRFCNDTGRIPQFTQDEFLRLHPVIIFDVSAQRENKSNLSKKVRVIITREGANTSGTDYYCLLLTESMTLVNPDGTCIIDWMPAAEITRNF